MVLKVASPDAQGRREPRETEKAEAHNERENGTRAESVRPGVSFDGLSRVFLAFSALGAFHAEGVYRRLYNAVTNDERWLTGL